MLRRTKNPVKSYEQIYQEWQTIQSLDIRHRLKSLKTLVYDICETYGKNTCDIKELEFYITVLKQILLVGDYPRYTRYLTKMIADWHRLTGNGEAKILKKISGKILVDRSIVIGDVQYSQDWIEVDPVEKNYTQLINNGKGFIFDAEIHDTCNLQIRVVDALEPIVSQKEFKCVVDTTETAIISIPSGIVAAANSWDLADENNRLLATIEPGNYKICVYLFYIHNKIESYYVVLCKTEKPAINNLSKIYNLFPYHL